MRRAAVRALLGVLLALIIITPVSSEQPRATNRVEVLEQLARDLRDYRSYLEDQLAASKVVIADLQERLDALDAALRECATKKKAPDK